MDNPKVCWKPKFHAFVALVAYAAASNGAIPTQYQGVWAKVGGRTEKEQCAGNRPSEGPMYITATQTADALAVAPSTPVARGAIVPGASFEITVKTQIRRNWLRPSNTTDDLSCEVLVRLLPDGGIQSVRIARSSGNGAFDRSVEAAVLKSDPLRKPPGGLREITFVFNAT